MNNSNNTRYPRDCPEDRRWRGRGGGRGRGGYHHHHARGRGGGGHFPPNNGRGFHGGAQPQTDYNRKRGDAYRGGGDGYNQGGVPPASNGEMNEYALPPFIQREAKRAKAGPELTKEAIIKVKTNEERLIQCQKYLGFSEYASFLKMKDRHSMEFDPVLMEKTLLCTRDVLNEFCEKERIPEDDKKVMESFINVLPFCAPMIAGFHRPNPRVAKKEDGTQLCHCPCGYKLRQWRDLMGFGEDDIPMCNGKNTKSKKFDANALMAHLEGVKTQSPSLKTRMVHHVTCYYLTRLYQNFWGLEITTKHWGLYKVGTEDYGKACDLDRQKNEKKHREEIARLKEQTKKIETKLTETQQRWKELMEKFFPEQGAPVPERSAEAIMAEGEPIKLRFFKLLEGWKAPHMVKVKGYDPIVNRDKRLTIRPSENFELSALFTRGWKERNHHRPKDGMLKFFRPISDWKTRLPFYLPLTVDFEKVVVKGTSDRNKATDEGGPTKEFLSSFLKQCPFLKMVQVKDKYMLQVEEGTGEKPFGLFISGDTVKPQQSDFLKARLKLDLTDDLGSVAKLRQIVGPYYQAIGRMLFCCLVNRVRIPTSFFPPMFQRKVFQGIDPTDGRYPIRELLHDVGAMMNAKEDENIMKTIISTFDDEEQSTDAKSPEAREKLFRELVKKQCVEPHSEPLAMIQEGLTLNGDFDKAFLLGSLDALNWAFFAPATFEPADVCDLLVLNQEIDENGDPVPQTDSQMKIFSRTEKGKIQGVLPRLILENKKNFAKKLLKFVTALDHVGFDDGLELKVEFTVNTGDKYHKDEVDDVMKDNYLPRSHTCENVLSIPHKAYGGDAAVFEQKIVTAVEASFESGFNIA